MKLLHLVGSTESELYSAISNVYYQTISEHPNTENYCLKVLPRGKFQFGKHDSELAEVSTKDLPLLCESMDLVIPYMFCKAGMTSYRSFFEDILNVPVVGSQANTTGLATSKWNTKCIASGAGVRIPDGELLLNGAKAVFSKPSVVKPDCEDNSLGVTLVHSQEEMDAAVRKAFSFDERVLVEEFISGTELRVAVLERQGRKEVLPLVEYHVTSKNPIRAVEDKITFDANGELMHRNCASGVIKTSCPAKIEDELLLEVQNLAMTMHDALQCRDYSLFDVRVDERNGQPVLLEAGLFWTFAPDSVITQMLTAQGRNLEEIYWEVWSNASKRR